MNRHFYRCISCLELTVIDGERLSEIFCDCGARLDYMGRVAGTSLRIDAERCACDSRCTAATGPHCDCSCGGVNHGTNRFVKIVINGGPVPRVEARTDLAIRIARINEFKRAVEDARARADILLNGAISQMQAGKWISDKSLWLRATDFQRAINKSATYKIHSRRMAALNAIAKESEI